jgi:hypothetical protein
LILKKLIDLGKVDVKDVAAEIGINPDALRAKLTVTHKTSHLPASNLYALIVSFCVLISKISVVGRRLVT